MAVYDHFLLNRSYTACDFKAKQYLFFFKYQLQNLGWYTNLLLGEWHHCHATATPCKVHLTAKCLVGLFTSISHSELAHNCIVQCKLCAICASIITPTSLHTYCTFNLVFGLKTQVVFQLNGISVILYSFHRHCHNKYNYISYLCNITSSVNMTLWLLRLLVARVCSCV